MAIMNFGGVDENVVTREEFPLEKAREILKDETIAVIGYGVQGPGQSMNLRDNGFNVIVGQRKGSKTWDKAVERQRLTMDLYSKAGVNPMGGCLPLLLQMPILIAMFTFFPSSIELRGESFLWAKDLSTYDAIVSWDTYIPLITPYFGNHISLFCLLMTITNLIYTKINMQNTAGQQQMPGMKFMMYLLPVMFLVFFNNYSAGLSYYYFLSLLITIIQTYVFRKCINEEKVLAELKENQKKPRKKSGFMARLEEAQRQQQAALREQQKQRNKQQRRR